MISALLTQLREYYDSHPLGLTFTGNRIAVEPLFDSDISPGGIVIVDEAKSRCTQGIIKYIGPACTSDYAVGDYVIFSGYSGDIIRFDEGLALVLPEDAIEGKVVAIPEDLEKVITQLRSFSSILDARTIQ
jgi:co-chaperonin GroES (HSP10)